MKISHSDKALLITITGASLLVLVFFFLGVKPYQGEIDEEFMEIPIITEDVMDTPKEIAQNQLQDQRAVRSNQAYNTAQLRQEQRSFQEDEIRKAIESQQEASVENLNTKNEERLAALQEEREKALKAQQAKIKAAIEARKADRKNKKQSAFRQSTASYDLVDRIALALPNPVYTCGALGKIVINISVNNDGAITSKTFNKNASTSSNGCLIEQAMKYLTRAYFDDSKKATQQGTVTFDFQG